MKKTILFLTALLFVVSVQAASRTFIITNEVTDAYYSRTPFKGWQAESVDFTLYAERYGAAVSAEPTYDGTSGYYPVWFLFDKRVYIINSFIPSPRPIPCHRHHLQFTQNLSFNLWSIFAIHKQVISGDSWGRCHA